MYKQARLIVLALIGPVLAQGVVAPNSSVVGTWVGKWDNAWCVQFTIGEGDASGAYTVTYTWLEQAPHPLRTLHRQGGLSGNRLSIEDPYIEIFFSNAKDQAVALGHFDKQRSAVLLRNSKDLCQDPGQSK